MGENRREEIRRFAYELWEFRKRIGLPDDPTGNWLTAERYINEKYEEEDSEPWQEDKVV
jgi:hypothetical protein